MPLQTPTYWTADLVRALPEDGQRHELVHGEHVVTPAPRVQHQAVLLEFAVRLHAYLALERVGTVLTSPADISWGPDTLLQPDLFVVPRGEAATREWSDIRHLLLAVEILSPSTARHDRFPKRRCYQEAGVPLYWIVDVDARQVEVWTPADRFPALERQALGWHPAGARSECRIELPPLFAGL